MMTRRLRYSSAYRDLTPEQRWWSCVDKTEGCWLWLGVPNASGYGTLKVEGRTVLAHRFGYEMLIGPIEVGKLLDHLCRNRRCVRPDHCEPVTSQVNTLRGDTLAAREAAQTHCMRGHALAGGNLINRRDGKRACRACNRERCAQWRREREYAPSVES